MNESKRPRRASMRGVSALLHDILDELEAAPVRQFDPLAHGGEEPAPDPAARGAAASLGDVVDRLDERSFGLLLFVLALPCVPPFVYVLPQIVSAPMLFLAGQMALGRRTLWLPQSLRRQTFSTSAFRDVVQRSEKFIRFVERLAHPRLRPVTGHGAARILGFLLLAPALSVMVPLPGTNTVPGIGIALTALGLIERDGLLVIAGLVIGVGWVAALLVLGAEAATILKDWLTAAF